MVEDREPERTRDREVERTTVVHSDGDRGGGGAGLVIGLLALLLLAALLFFLFGGGLGNSDEGDVNVNVEAPNISVPDVDVPEVSADAGETGTDTANTSQ